MPACQYCKAMKQSLWLSISTHRTVGPAGLHFKPAMIRNDDMQDPVISPEGYLYSREAIYESLLAQKKANKRKQAAWEEQQLEDSRKVKHLACSDLNGLWQMPVKTRFKVSSEHS